jgi:hypothetical protein
MVDYSHPGQQSGRIGAPDALRFPSENAPRASLGRLAAIPILTSLFPDGTRSKFRCAVEGDGGQLNWNGTPIYRQTPPGSAAIGLAMLGPPQAPDNGSRHRRAGCASR